MHIFKYIFVNQIYNEKSIFKVVIRKLYINIHQGGLLVTKLTQVTSKEI
jgi:hypothetical protein